MKFRFYLSVILAMATTACEKSQVTSRSIHNPERTVVSKDGGTAISDEQMTFIAVLPSLSKTILVYDSGKYEWAAADRIWINDGTNEIVYKADKGGEKRTTISYHRSLNGEKLNGKAELFKAVYPLSYAVCGGFPEVQEFCMSDRNFVVPMYAEAIGGSREFKFESISGFLRIPAQVKTKDGLKYLTFSADEPLSGPMEIKNYPEPEVSLKGNAGVKLQGNVMSGEIVLSLALPAGTYHNMKAQTPEGQTISLGEVSIRTSEITLFPRTIVFE